MLETLSNLRILLVQENENDRLLFRRAFQKSDISCEIIECSRAEETIEQLSTDAQSFDVVAVDHNLPGISGMDLCRKLLDNKIPPPLVLLAEIGSEQLVAEALKAGVHDYIIKDPEQGYLELLPISLINIARRHFDRMVDKRTESRLSESEQTFKTIFDNAADGILLADIETKKFYMGNHVICQMLGYDSQELTALGVMDIHPEQDVPHVMEQFEKQARGEITLAIDIPIRKKDGSVFYADVNAFSITLDGKRYLMGIFRNVSERKKAEQESRDSKYLLEKVFSSLDRAVFVLGNSKPPCIIDCNPAALDIFGYPKSRMIGQTIDVLHTNTESLREFQEILYSAIETQGHLSSFEFRMKRRDGRIFPTEHSIYPLKNDKGDRIGWVSIVSDITERKKAENALIQSEEKFRLAMEATNDALWDWNMVTNEVYRNPRHATMLGYEPHELTASQNEWENRIHPDDRQALFQIRDEHLAGKRDVFEIEYRLRTKSGDYIWVLGRGKIVAYNNDGSPARMVGTNIDITERKRADEVKTKNQAIIRGIMDNSGSTFVVRNLQGQYLMVNRNVEKILGMESEQIIGKTPFDIHTNDKADKILADDKKVIESRSLLEIEDQLDVNGKIRIFQGTKFPLINADGEIYAVCTIATDTTERKQAEEELRQSEEKFCLAMEATDDALWDWNIVTNKLYRNPRHATMLGYEPHELTESQFEWEKLVHPDDKQSVLEVLNEHLSGKRDSFEIEYRLRAKSGDFIWVLGRGKIVAYNDDGSPARMIGTNIDITERKKQYKRDKIILKTCIDGFWLANSQGRILEVNDAYCRMSGYSRDELLTMKIQDIEAAEAPQDVLQHIQRIMDKGFHRFQSSHRRKDGTIMDLDISANYLDIDGERTFTFFRDITAARQADEEIRKFKTIADKAGHGVAIVDLQGNIVYMNDSFAQMHQYSIDELIGKKLSIFHTVEQLERVNQLNDRLKQEGGYVAEEVWHTKRDNTVFPTLMSATLVSNESGEPLFMAATAIDITERKRTEETLRESENRLKYLVSSSPAVIYTSKTSGDYGTTYISENVDSQTGYEARDFVETPTFWIEHIHPDDRKHIFDALSVLFEKGWQRYEYRFLHKDGSYRWMIDELKLVRDEQGNPLEIIGSWMDITEHKKAEEALQESELRYRTLFETLPVGVGLSTLDGRIIDANSTFQQMLGYSIEEMGRINVVDTYHNPAERAPYLKQLQQDGFVRDFEVQLKRKDGTIFLASLNVTLMRMRDETVLVTAARDITEQRNMERALAESEEKYRTLVEGARDSIYSIDERGVFLFANKMGAETLGCQPEDLVGKTLWDVFPKEIAERQAANVRKTIETGQGMNSISVTEIQKKPRWYSAFIEPLRNNHGRVTAAMIIARDIDDMKRAEEQIQKLSSAVEQSIDGVAMSGLDKRLLYVNDSYARIHGYTPEEMGGMKIADLYANNEKDEYTRTINQINTQGSFTGEVEHVRKDGIIFPAYLSITLLKNDKEEAIGNIAICKDMTEYKHTQEMLEIKNAALESSINGIVIGNIEGNLTYVNNAFLKIWGYKDQSEVLEKNASEFWKVNDKAEEIVNALRSGEGWIGELTAVRKDGSLFDIQVCQTSIKDENGTIISLMASFVDITESKRREEELSKYRGQMARAEQLASLGTLSATVAHQLTQPLTVIRLSMDNALDELEATSSSETVIRRLKDSVTQVSNITSIIGDFRNFARKSSGRTVAEVNLKAVAVKIAMLLSESARSANIVLRVKDMGDLPCPWMNETDLEQLFFALIENSIQAADGKKTRQLMISGVVKDNHIELRLSDNCGGIAPENIDKIFEPFFTTKPRGQGTGLGLCIVQDAISRMGGNVRVENEFGKGTTFIINLPVETGEIS